MAKNPRLAFPKNRYGHTLNNTFLKAKIVPEDKTGIFSELILKLHKQKICLSQISSTNYFKAKSLGQQQTFFTFFCLWIQNTA